MKLTSAATESTPFHSLSADSSRPIVAAIGHLRFRSRDVLVPGTYSKLRMSWWVEQTSNGWTPCRGHEHPTPEDALVCWRDHAL